MEEETDDDGDDDDYDSIGSSDELPATDVVHSPGIFEARCVGAVIASLERRV